MVKWFSVMHCQQLEIKTEALTRTKMADNNTCTMCLKSFPYASHLSKHLSSHSGEKLHKCSQCNKSFGLATNLKKHILTHSGEKVQKCAQCDKSFGQVVHMKRHLLTVSCINVPNATNHLLANWNSTFLPHSAVERIRKKSFSKAQNIGYFVHNTFVTMSDYAISHVSQQRPPHM